jgi:hypothetical protein
VRVRKNQLLRAPRILVDASDIRHDGKGPGLEIHRARREDGCIDDALDQAPPDRRRTIRADSAPLLDHLQKVHAALSAP